MKRYLVIVSLLFGFQSFAQNKSQVLDFDLTLDQLSEIRMKSDFQPFQIQPGLELSLEELNEIQIHKVVKETSTIGFGYDLTIDELSELNLSAITNNFHPDYSASLNTLSKLSLKKEYLIDSQISVPFGVSIETLVKLTLVD